MCRASFSLSSCLEVVPEATSEWKPEIAPQAIVTNNAGKILPVVKSPFEAACVNPLNAGILRVPFPVADAPIIPITDTAIMK